MSIVQGDALQILKKMPDESIDCVITSPPYWALRDYGVDGQIGLEKTHHAYIENLLSIFDQIKRILKNEGTCWVNIGDTYGAQKCLLMIPSTFAIEMMNQGWILRNEIIWHKPNAMPNSVKDRFNTDYEKIFFFVKQKKYYFNQQLEPAKENSIARGKRGMSESGKWKHGAPGQTGHSMNLPRLNDKNREVSPYRNKRCVWSIATHPFRGAHFAVFPEKLIETPIKAGCPEGGIVLDPFCGAGTTGVVAKKQGKNFIGIELNPEYIKIAEKRIKSIS